MSRFQDIDALLQTLVRVPDDATPQHVRLRGNRRIIGETLAQAVRARDMAALELAVHRLHRLGVEHKRIKKMVTEAQS